MRKKRKTSLIKKLFILPLWWFASALMFPLLSQTLVPPITYVSQNPLAIEWGSYYQTGSFYSKEQFALDEFSPLKRALHNAVSIKSSCTDEVGNLYVVGKGLNPQKAAEKDSVCDAFVSRFKPDGSLAWTFFIGSSAFDEACVVGINSRHEIYVAGSIEVYPFAAYERTDYESRGVYRLFDFPVWENDFPTTPKTSALNADTGCMFILKLDSNGKCLWSSLYGPEQDNSLQNSTSAQPLFMHIDRNDQVYIGLNAASIRYNKREAGGYIEYTSLLGKDFPVFGSPKNYLCHYDTLVGEDQTFFKRRQMLLKLNTSDSVVWSTYLPFWHDMGGVKTDSKNNVYVYGRTVELLEPPVLRKKGAYFKKRSVNTDRSKKVSCWSFLLQFDSLGAYGWGTHLGDDYMNGAYVYTTDMMIDKQDHVFLTGFTNTEYYPLQEYTNPNARTHKLAKGEEKGGYYEAASRTFITEFNGDGAMIYSERIGTSDSNSHMGMRLQSDLNGGFWLLGRMNNHLPSYNGKVFYDCLADTTQAYLLHYNSRREIDSRQSFLLKLTPISGENPYCSPTYDKDRNNQIIGESTNYIRKYTGANLQLSLSAFGRLFITGNTLQMPASLFKKSSDSAYFQDKTHLPDPISGFILKYNLCDTSVANPIRFSSADTLFCEGESIKVNLRLNPRDYEQYRLVWMSGTPQEKQANEFEIDRVGKYYVEARNIYSGCPTIYSDTFEVAYCAKPEKIFTQDTMFFCVGNSEYKLDVSQRGPATYLWSDGSKNPIYKFKYEGSSHLDLSCQVTLCQYKVEDSIHLRFLPPYAFLGGDTTACWGDSLFFDAETLNKELSNQMSYAWSFRGKIYPGIEGHQGQCMILPQDSGQLCLSVSWPKLGCEPAVDTIQIKRHAQVDLYFEVQDTTVCENDGVYLEIQNSNMLEVNYLWLNTQNDSIGKGKALFLEEDGFYFVEGQAQCSFYRDSVKVSFYPEEWTALRIAEDTGVCPEKPLVLDPRVSNTTTQYAWDQEALSTNGAVKTFLEAGEHTLTLKDTAGCENTYTILIKEEDCTAKLEIPNVFTPNGDGVNDMLKVKTAEKIFDFEIYVYNRWGIEVCRYKGPFQDFMWNGKNRSGQELSAGVYFYVSLYKDIQDKKQKQSGSITILR